MTKVKRCVNLHDAKLAQRVLNRASVSSALLPCIIQAFNNEERLEEIENALHKELNIGTTEEAEP